MDTKICGCSSPIIGPTYMWISCLGIQPTVDGKQHMIRGWLNPWMQIPWVWRADCIFIEKYASISGPGLFKPMLFKGQL